MPELKPHFDCVGATHEGDQLITDNRRTSGFVEWTETLCIAPAHEVRHSVAAEVRRWRSIVSCRVRNMRQFCRILPGNRAVSLIPVQVANREMAQQRGGEDMVPVEAV